MKIHGMVYRVTQDLPVFARGYLQMRAFSSVLGVRYFCQSYPVMCKVVFILNQQITRNGPRDNLLPSERGTRTDKVSRLVFDWFINMMKQNETDRGVM